MRFSEFTPSSKGFQLNDVKIFNTVLFSESNLSGLLFTNCDVRSCRFIFNKTAIKDFVFDSVKWPNRDFVEVFDDQASPGIKALIGKLPADLKLVPKRRVKRSQEQYLSIQGIYRHFKFVAVSNKDKPNQLKFHSLEMYAYYKSLHTITNFNDKAILWVGRVTNYFGLNWILPVVWYIGITILFYSIIYLKTEGVHPTHFLCMYAEVDLGIMFNPAHKFSSYQTIEYLNSFWVMLDNFLRIFQGLLVYQTISAFRKFFKS